MKKALALVLALVLALSMGVSAFATVELIELDPAESKKSDKVTVEVVDITDAEFVLYTRPVLDDVAKGKIDWLVEYYVALEDEAWEDVKVTANGNVTAELVEYDPATMDVIGLDIYFQVVDKEGNSVAGYNSGNTERFDYDYEAYEAAKKYADDLNDAERAMIYSVKVKTNVNIIKLVVENNFSAHYTEGTLKVEAKLDDKNYVGTTTVINDVCIYEYEEVKYAAEKNADGAYLQYAAGGYSDYWTSELGYNYDVTLGYDKDLLRELPFALVVSTTAFRAIEGKDLTVAVCPALDLRGDDDVEETEVSVTLKDIAKGQKGVNFFATAEVEGIDLEDGDRYPTAITVEFLGKQVINGEFEVKVALPINYYELRELFGIKVEEDDIISYYVVDETGKVVGGKEVDYMTADLTETVEFTATGSNKALGSYTLCLEVPAAESGEANPNTGAESVVGVVAALAVVSVATAAAVSLKK